MTDGLTPSARVYLRYQIALEKSMEAFEAFGPLIDKMRDAARAMQLFCEAIEALEGDLPEEE